MLIGMLMVLFFLMMMIFFVKLIEIFNRSHTLAEEEKYRTHQKNLSNQQEHKNSLPAAIFAMAIAAYEEDRKQ